MFQDKSRLKSTLLPLALIWLAVHAALLAVILSLKFLTASTADGIRVVAINPGPTVPGRHLPHVMARAKRLFGDENRWPELHSKFPAGRAGQASEVAELVVFLASDRAKFISGTAVDIDGGHSVYRPDA